MGQGECKLVVWVGVKNRVSVEPVMRGVARVRMRGEVWLRVKVKMAKNI